METVMKELINATPFGVFSLIFIWILSRAHKNSLAKVSDLQKTLISEIKEVYEKVYSGFEKRSKK